MSGWSEPLKPGKHTFEYKGKPYQATVPDDLPTPLQDRVLVRRIEEPEGLIIKPDIAKQKPLKAEVLKVGPGKRREDSDGGWYFIPTQVKAGQTVLLSPTVNMGNWSDIIEGSGVTMIQEADILGVLEG